RRTTATAAPVPRTRVVCTTFTSGSVRVTTTGLRAARMRLFLTRSREAVCWVVVQPATAPSPPAASRHQAAATRFFRLAKGTAHVVPCPLLGRRGEQAGRAAVLDQLAEVHEADVVGHPVGLLQVAGDDHDPH